MHIKQHALITSAATVTFTLWAATLVSATTYLGGHRLHLTLLAGSLTASIWLIALAGISQMKCTVYQFDRGYNIGVRGVVQGLVDVARQRDRDDN
ncbi:hypothetical protein [Herbidospora mongoliensis]|uniref:hypothetical protein n=1 Tax=Herbidospora mongoliensis TaxID=688067 RepID=UPI00082EF1E0|nr:hypothetical protein [Herbidospora mongoliensis]